MTQGEGNVEDKLIYSINHTVAEEIGTHARFFSSKRLMAMIVLIEAVG